MITVIVKFQNGNVTSIATPQAELDTQGATPTLRAVTPNGAQQISMTLEEASQVFIDGVIVFNGSIMVKPN